jgi:hypothetical protein
LAGDARDGASVDFAALARRAQVARELQVSDRIPLRQGGEGAMV